MLIIETANEIVNPLKMYTSKNENPILQLTLSFALDIMHYTNKLSNGQRLMSDQLWRSGTAIGALVAEAQNAESRTDFIHKLKIAAKEGGETEYWLTLCSKAGNFPDTTEMLNKVIQINKILTKIISTAKQNVK